MRFLALPSSFPVSFFLLPIRMKRTVSSGTSFFPTFLSYVPPQLIFSPFLYPFSQTPPFLRPLAGGRHPPLRPLFFKWGKYQVLDSRSRTFTTLSRFFPWGVFPHQYRFIPCAMHIFLFLLTYLSRAQMPRLVGAVQPFFPPYTAGLGSIVRGLQVCRFAWSTSPV